MKVAVFIGLVLSFVLVATVARADVDCAQCRALCKSKDQQRSYPEELGPEAATQPAKHKTPDAEAAFSDARKKDPAFGGRDLAGAIQSYKRAIALDPDNAQYRNHIAAALMTAGYLDEAVYNLDQATRLVPSEAKFLVNLGYAHHRKGDETRSLLYYMRALMLDPRDVRARLFAGYALEILGYNDEAVTELKKVLVQDANNDGAKRALLRLGAGPDPIGAPPPPMLPR